MPVLNLGVTPNDVAISANGALIYASGRWSDPFAPVATGDGNLRIYDAVTGALLHNYAVGTRLGAMAVSPDGSFALICELAPAAGIATLYRVNLTSGAVETFNYTLADNEKGPFFDVALLADGTAYLTLNYNGSGPVYLRTFNSGSGGFFGGTGHLVGQNSFLTASPDGSELLIGYANLSNAPMHLYTRDPRLIVINDDAATGFNRGQQAIDSNTGMVAQAIYGDGLHIYDGALHHQIDLTDANLGWRYEVDALAFDPTGQFLFILLDSSKKILQVSTLNWAVVQEFDVGAQPTYREDFGGRLVISPTGEFLTVTTTAGLIQIAVPAPASTVAATENGETITGTDAIDIINGLGGNDTINGGAGSDYLTGGAGNDIIIGGEGDDALTGGDGDDQLEGGAGNDTANYISAAGGVTINLALTGPQATGGAGFDTLTGIENLYGTGFGDTLIGNAQANVIRGQAGNDILVGGAAADFLSGGAGFDTVDYSQETGLATVYVNLTAQDHFIDGIFRVDAFAVRDTFGTVDFLSSIERVNTGAGNDFVFGSVKVEIFDTGAGDDFLDGGGGADQLIGGSGNDIYLIWQPDGATVVELAGGGIDEIRTANSIFSLAGYANVENLIGRTYDQTLIGNELANRITGFTGNDTLTGGAGADVLVGGQGVDTFRDTAAGLNGDTILDLSPGERIIISDADLATFTFSLSGGRLTYSGGQISLQAGLSGTLVASAAAGGGVQITIQTLANDVAYDFNGDGRSDILWRSDTGQLSDWLANANGNGGFTANDANALTNAPFTWHVVGTGDFNGDGKDDLLWRNNNGQLSDWLANASGNGGFTANDANAFTTVSTSWAVVGVGDFNGDGKDDILWRNGTTGQMSDWLANANGNGGFTPNDANALTTVATSWVITGVGDFNGDGKDDLLWRNTATGQLSNWLANASGNGGFTPNDANAFNSVPLSWTVVGIGDFNGDNRDDLLWRNGTTGQLSNWLANASGNGGFAPNDGNAFSNAPLNWHIVAVGDYNGDNRDDILWRSDSGQLSNWLANANGLGGFTANDANALTSAPTNWFTQAPDTLTV